MSRKFGKSPSSAPSKRLPKTPTERALYTYNINDYLGTFKDTDFNEIDLGNGLRVKTNRFSLFQEAHILAKTYGMGGCRSFTEFVNMVNEEDPMVINTFMALLTEEARVNCGFEPRDITDKPSTPVQQGVPNISGRESGAKSFVSFLANNGISAEQLKSAEEKVKAGQYKPSNDNFSDITSDNIENIDLKDVIKRMRKARKESIEFKITPKQFHNFGNVKKDDG